MKVTQDKPEFQPITIVLEEEAELRAVRVALFNLYQHGVNQTFQNLCRDLYNKLATIS